MYWFIIRFKKISRFKEAHLRYNAAMLCIGDGFKRFNALSLIEHIIIYNVYYILLNILLEGTFVNIL